MVVPFILCQERVHKRPFGQFADIPEVVEESFHVVFSQDEVQQRVIEQDIEFLVDKLSSQTSEKCDGFVKTVWSECPREVASKLGVSRRPRSQAKTKCCTVFLCRR